MTRRANKHKLLGRRMNHSDKYKLLQMPFIPISLHYPTFEFHLLRTTDMQRPRPASPSNQNGPSSRAERITQGSPFVLDGDPENSDVNGSRNAESATNDVHINGQQDDITIDHDGHRHQLRRQAGQLFDPSEFNELRRFYASRNTTSSSLQVSDPEDAPNRPHIVPPQDGWSSTEESSPRQIFPPEWGTLVVQSPARLDIPRSPSAHNLDSRERLNRSEAITVIKK
jgi:hypothetical protein